VCFIPQHLHPLYETEAGVSLGDGDEQWSMELLYAVIVWQAKIVETAKQKYTIAYNILF